MVGEYDICLPAAQCNYVRLTAPRPGEPLSGVDRAVLLALYKEHGAVLLRGFALDLASFNEMTSAFCSRFVSNESSGRQAVSSDGRTQTVNIGHEAFPLHPELAREPWKPDIAWFACVNPPGRGGETLLCDGIAIVEALPAELRAALGAKQLEYKMPVAKAECERALGHPDPDQRALERLSERTPFRFTVENGQYFRSFRVPFFHRPMFSPRPAFGSFLLFARYYHGLRDFPLFDDGTLIPDEICAEIKRVSDELTVALPWRVNDLLMLDNTRFLHGRNAVVDPAERMIWTQFGYAAFAPIDAQQRRRQPWRQ